MGANHPAVYPAFRSSPLAAFYDEPVTVENGTAQITGTVDNIWRWFTDKATGIHVITPAGGGDHIVLGDSETWTVTHTATKQSYTHDGKSNPFVPEQSN
ncbi:hypothetical protein MTY66_60770 (plasmid) [Mycolicibacterium sp. TY66]|jgi:hypothetical protein|uniref:hypothetical protein n=1 Tax=unclassified Mycolicibacterium TaxID=2636767 RepID=UPI001BB3C343|nr:MULTISPECIES: hypothetical protein [unclassified Mycolicibacterium]BCI84452.1 hypothetical protein MTY66_60770 [Mycolicibacterium sp. TY66]BCJ84684.1 hypothetical protein MTY81_60570 [Mycolicibacterium sp. TY81]